MSLGYATSPRGGSHQDMRHLPERAGLFDRRDPNGKAQLNYDITSTTTIRDTLNYCAMIEDVIGRVGLSERHAELLNAVTGLNFSVQDVQRLADRIWNLERAFNVREGMSRKDDVLPYRFMNEPIPEGPSQGMYCPPEELERMKDELYKLRRWTPEGIPSKELLLDLGLDDVAAELWP
jgi:aldehyde:ferredoxin oxidoreductase